MNKKAKKFQFKRGCAMLLVIAMLLTSFAMIPASAEAANTKYWIKVNKKANVATVYQLKGDKYKPVKAMLVSCGGKKTPIGTFYTPAKYRWRTLIGPSYGQYCTRVTGHILFHSVWYYHDKNKATQSTREFNKLGQTASHGCIRLSVADAKWIYDNCKLKTKVTIYSSKNPGPLGKPKAIKVSTSRKAYWDPTDPDKKNPYRKIKANIYVSSKKDTNLEYGQSYNVKSGITAKDQITKRSLTKNVKYSSYKYSNGKYIKAKFSTKSLGTYKIKYFVKSSLGVTTSRELKIRVRDTKAPIIKANNYIVKLGSTNAVKGVSAKMISGTSRTKYITAKIKAPGSKEYKTYSYSKAKAYKFNKTGTYYVKYYVKNKNKPYRQAVKSIKITSYRKYKTYSYSKAKAYKFNKTGTYYVKYYVKNKNKPYRQAVKSIKITSYRNAVINGTNIVVPQGTTDEEMITKVRNNVTVSDNGTTIKGTSSKVSVKLEKKEDGSAVATVSYKGKNGTTITKKLLVKLDELTEDVA